MKYDFSTYLTQALNEKVKQPSYDTVDDIKKALDRWVADNGEMYNAQNQDKISDDTLLKIKKSKAWKEFLKNADKKYKDRIDIIKELDTNKEQKAKSLDKDGFELLGKTIAYRSALTVWNIINNSGDDFKQAALDVFKDNSEYSIKQLENLDSLLDYSAAIGVVKDKKNRLEKDKNDANYESLLKKFNETEAKLATKENYTTIQLIKKDYEKEFNDKRDVFEKAFNDGMAEQKKDMQAKDYKWKDPATGLPPKGKLAKSNQAADAIFKAIQSGVEKADEFAKKQQGLDKAILTLAVMGVKGMMSGGKLLKKLLSGFLKKTNLKDIMRYTAKFNDVKDKINVFKKEYDEWKKYNDAQQQKKEKTDDEKKEEEDRKKTISMKLTELMNTHVIPYYYCKMAIIVACFENIEGKYIIKQENNKWSTYNSGSGRLTIIEDNAILMERILEVVNDQLVKKGVFETLKDESSADAFKGIPKDLKYKKDYADKLLKWKDKIKSVSTVSKFNKDNLKNILNVYNEKVIVNGFASYTEFAEYVPTAQGLVKQHDIPVAKEIVIKFEGDEDAGIPGIITGAKKEETKEEQNPEENKEEKENYQKILNSVEEIKNAANAEEIAKNYGDTKGKVDTAVKQIQSNIQDQEKKDFLDKHFQNIEKADTLTKMMYLNTAKSKGLFDSCIAFNDAMNMLLEATDDDNTNGYEEIFKQMVALLNGDSNEEKIKEFQELDNKLKDALKDKIKDEGVKKTLGEDPLAIYSFLNKPKQDNKDEQAKIDNTIEDTKKALEFAEDVKEVFTTEYYDKLKAELKTIYDKIEKICDNNDDKLKAFTDVTIDDEIKSDLIPNLWKYKRFLTLISDSKSFYYHDFMISLEEENVVDELTKKAQVIKKLLTYENEPDFNKDYKEWREGVNTEFEKFEKIENKDSLKDPVQKLSAMGMYVKNNKNKPEEKKEGEQPNGDNKPNQENGENKQET